MKNYKLTIGFLLIAVVCYTASSIIGSEVLENGILKEPFYLVAIAGFSVIAAIVSGLISTVLLLVNRLRK